MRPVHKLSLRRATADRLEDHMKKVVLLLAITAWVPSYGGVVEHSVDVARPQFSDDRQSFCVRNT
jgi:hypothetical protein